jgi:hypothetical protein
MPTENLDVSTFQLTTGLYAKTGMAAKLAWVFPSDPEQTLWLYDAIVVTVSDTLGVVTFQLTADPNSPATNQSPPFYANATDAPGGAFSYQTGSSLNPTTFSNGQFCLETQCRTSQS